jgi:hypothetical protein
MRERPMLFSAPMVRAVLAGTKTQTRRVVKLPHQNPLGRWEVLPWGGPNGGRTRDGRTVPFQNVIGHSRTGEIIGCPHGQPGDRLWVREAWRTVKEADDTPPRDMDAAYRLWYEADAHADHHGHQLGYGKLRPGMFMPRWASRITLEVTGVRVERLQDISEADAIAEGAPSADLASGRECIFPHQGTHRWGFRLLWESINGPGSWDANPWVWVVEFKRVGAA